MIKLRVLLCVWFVMTTALVVHSQDLSRTHEAQSIYALILTTAAGFISLVVTQIFVLIKDGRQKKWDAHKREEQRKWDLQDRETARREAAHQREQQRREMILLGVALAKLGRATREDVMAQIEKNTVLTLEVGQKAEQAYKAANNFNEKVEQIRQEMAQQKTMEIVESTTAAANVKLDNILTDLEETD